ncbi:MAG: hypothetical protein ACLFV3_09195 [Phycisphaeraceae bacterium]
MRQLLTRPNLDLPLAFGVLLFALGLVLASCAMTGCRIARYTGPEGREVQTASFFSDTEVGEVEVHTADGGRMIVRNLTLEERLTELNRQLLNAMVSQGSPLPAAPPSP